MDKSDLIKKELASRYLYDRLRGKGRELMYMSRVLDMLGVTNFNIIEDERPDYYIYFGDIDDSKAIVGCELTEYFSDMTVNGSMAKRFVEIWKEFDNKLYKALSDIGLDNLYGSVHFKAPSHKVLDRVSLDDLVNEIVVVCKNVVKSHGLCFKSLIPCIDEKLHPLLNSLVDRLVLSRWPGKQYVWFPSHIRSGNVDPSDSVLASIVQKKSHSASGYSRRQVGEMWLLIVAAGDIIETSVCLKEWSAGSVADINYDRILLLDGIFADVIQLYPVYSKLCDSREQLRRIENYPNILLPYFGGDESYPTRTYLKEPV